jgi:DNA modification methylase
MCLYAIKGKKPVTHIYGDVITATGDPSSIHGARKPVAVFENLLMRSVRPGDAILDPFAGTGTIFRAAIKFQCECVGIEMSASSAGICMETLDAIGKQLSSTGAPAVGAGEEPDGEDLLKGLAA